MFECRQSVTDFSVFIKTENSWMKVFPKDYAKFIEVLLLALRKNKAEFVVNHHVVFWYDTAEEASAFTCLEKIPYTDYLTENQVRDLLVTAIEAEKLYVSRYE